jgi:hypothetical protein
MNFSTKNIIKSFFITALITISENSSAEICNKIEFAELESFSKDELLSMRCKYYDLMLATINKAYISLKTGTGEHEIYQNISMKCADEQRRMDRILINKHKIPSKDVDLHNISQKESENIDAAIKILDRMAPKEDSTSNDLIGKIIYMCSTLSK